MVNNYIFGIGSLVNNKSRKLTLKKHTKSIPVVFDNHNYNRNWICFKKTRKSPVKFNRSVLNLDKNKMKKNEKINGVLFLVNKKQLKKLDKREARYNRIKLNNRDFHTTKKYKIPSKKNIYAYTSKVKYIYPNKNCKLRQSYMDVTLDGFLNHGKKFARKFKTKIKKKYTLNDRKNKKKYNKYDFSKKLNYKNIDKIIKENNLYTK